MAITPKFYLKRGDTSPAIVFTLSPTVDLSGASVVFNMKTRTGGAVVTRGAADIVAPASAGVVSYDWQTADTSNAGIFYAEFEVTYADATIETFPNASNIIIQISDDLG